MKQKYIVQPHEGNSVFLPVKHKSFIFKCLMNDFFTVKINFNYFVNQIIATFQLQTLMFYSLMYSFSFYSCRVVA